MTATQPQVYFADILARIEKSLRGRPQFVFANIIIDGSRCEILRTNTARYVCEVSDFGGLFAFPARITVEADGITTEFIRREGEHDIDGDVGAYWYSSIDGSARINIIND